MPLYKPSELRAFLDQIGVSPKRSLSQNFLIDGNIIKKIVALADVRAGETVLEIGPGPGVLTEALLNQGAFVIAVEKDRKFAQALHRLQTPDNRLTVIEADILEANFELPPGSKLISNLPYQITTPVLTQFLPQKHHLESITVMVQKEVAQRLTARPGSKTYGSITVFIQFYASARFGFTVEPTCFYPPPRVQSAVIKFDLRDPPLVSQERFFEMTRLCFQMRRKMVRTSLKDRYPVALIEKGLEKIGKGENVRPEELSLADFLTLFQEIEDN